MLHSHVTLVSKPPILHLLIIYPLPLPLHRPLLLAVLLRLLPPASSPPPLTLSGFVNGMLEVFEPGALNYFTFSRPIQSTLSAFRNPILTPLPLSRFLDSLLCALIAPTPDLAFSLLMPRTPATALSFSSGRAYPFLNFLLPLFLRLIPTLDYVGINISLNNSFSVSFLNVYAPHPLLPNRWQNRLLFSLHSSLLQKFFILGDFNCHYPLWNSRGTSDPCREEVFD